MLNIAIIIGSTRPNRKGKAIAEWVNKIAVERKDAEFELIDLKIVGLPFLDEPESPMMGKYTQQHTKDWSNTIKYFDAFIFVTPEYNHGISAVLKNALDFLYKEWNNKAAGFVGYGMVGATRAVEQLRMVMGELQVASVRNQVALTFAVDFEKGEFKPGERQEKSLNEMIDQLLRWGEAMKEVRKSIT